MPRKQRFNKYQLVMIFMLFALIVSGVAIFFITDFFVKFLLVSITALIAMSLVTLIFAHYIDK